MTILDTDNWKRKQLFEHFKNFKDPYFGIITSFEVSKAYHFAKTNKISFFGRYLHDCMRAINDTQELKIRILDENVVSFEKIHASATLMRGDKTFGFSFIKFDSDREVFLKHLVSEKKRIENSAALFPPENGLDCVHCSALPWLGFSGHKEPVSGMMDSVPKLAFSKIERINKNKIKMNVAISVNHALVDGYHLGVFAEKFQYYLNS